MIEQADALAQRHKKDASLLSMLASDSIKGWLEKTIPNPPSSIDEVDHPLASSSTTDTSGETFLPRGSCQKGAYFSRKVKEESMSPGEVVFPLPCQSASADPQREDSVFRPRGRQGKILLFPKETSTHRGKCSCCSSSKIETESARSVHPAFCTGSSLGGETSGKWQKTQSH